MRKEAAHISECIYVVLLFFASATASAATLLLLFLFLDLLSLLGIASPAQADISIRVEVCHASDVQAPASVLLHLRLAILLILLVFDDFLRQISE